MRKYVLEVFNDVVYGTTTVYTATKFNEPLGMVDKIGCQAVADQTGGTSPTLEVLFQTSNDQRNWATKTTLIPNTTSIPAGATTPVVGTDAGTTPSLGYGRFAITLGGSGPSAHLKITVCGRDDG